MNSSSCAPPSREAPLTKADDFFIFKSKNEMIDFYVIS